MKFGFIAKHRFVWTVAGDSYSNDPNHLILFRLASS